ncbi:MAG: hypothetical protein LBC71_06010 [Oscillospiraceae bacterium]|nr:hypothetical protein [Oscillospiraceae bacterium]
MNNIYVYKGQDITIDVILKIEHVVRLIAEKKSRDFDDCYNDFICSKTYIALQNTNSVMWAESAQFIVDEYFREIDNQE